MSASPPCPLDETTDLLEWYLYAVGESEVPEIFHHWCFLSLMAACVQNRVWRHSFGSKLYPNLYVMLLGDSGSGKNTAVKLAQRLGERLDSPAALGLYRGKITPQALMSRLGSQAEEKAKKSAYIWFLTPEVSMAIGEGDQAKSFIKHMTELYEGDYEFQEETRTRGHYRISDPCVNWLAASTPDWLVGSVSRNDLRSGFFARVQPVWGVKSEQRYPEPILPPRAEEAWHGLAGRLNYITTLGGAFQTSPQAVKTHRQWYLHRPRPPKEEGTLPYWERQNDIVWKLAMLFSLCRAPDMVIRAVDLQRAIDYSETIRKTVPELQEYTYQNEHTDQRDFVLTLLHRMGGVAQHSQLLRKLSNRGVNAKTFETLIETLVGERRIVVKQRKSPGRGGKSTEYSLIDEEYA